MITKKKKKAEGAAIKTSYYDIIRTPVITEKSTMMADQNKLVFNVAKHASKREIKAAVEALFSVKVKKVNTLNRLGKSKLFRGQPGKKADAHRAIVTLAEGQNIDIAAGVK